MPVPKVETLASLVHVARGERVIFDADLASLYGVTTKALNQAVSRNRRRFPPDFMFQLTPDEWATMRSQTVTTSSPAMRSQIVTSVFHAIKRLISEDDARKAVPKRRIGFVP
jgi:hypothetical protein